MTDELKEKLVWFGALPLAALGLLYCSTLKLSFLNESTLYLIFLLLVAITAWLADIQVGILITAIFACGLFLLKMFHIPSQTSFSPLTVGVFVLVGIIVSFFIDVAKKSTEIARLKNIIRQTERTMASLNENLEKAKKSIQARDELLSVASHELKTPLTSTLLQLRSMLHSIRTTSLAKFSVSELMKVLEGGEHQINKLAKMINDLHNVSLVTTGKLELDRETVDLGKTVRMVVKNLSELLKRERYKVNIWIDKRVSGKWDQVRVEQVITNLLTNAIKYGEGKPIEIKIRKAGKWGELTVTDQGIGIDPEKQSALFDKFKRGEPTGKQDGLGVGLYIAAQVVKAHNGTIKLKSQKGKGSTFTVALPLS